MFYSLSTIHKHFTYTKPQHHSSLGYPLYKLHPFSHYNLLYHGSPDFIVLGKYGKINLATAISRVFRTTLDANDTPT
jgi:hypothetical protein